VVDADDNELPPGEVGELLIGGEQVMLGYHNRDADTGAVIRDGWFHSGDAATLDEDGFIYIRDRIKDMVVSGGENVYPIEVESVIAEHPAVADVAVIGVPDHRWGETVKAVVVLRDGATVTEQELIEFCRPRLAGFKRPTSVDFVQTIPRNPTGKILKRELREPYWQGQQRRVAGSGV
jgi:acyl-CoA synthetase (AMP-forming)/AMP-acid ligase II